jgi:hypothetical protein
MLVKKFEESIERHISIIKTAIDKEHGISFNGLIKVFDNTIIDEDIKNNPSEFYLNLKIAFFNKGFVIKSKSRTKVTGETIIFFRYKTASDEFPRTLDNFNCDNLTISKDTIKDMEDIRELTSKYKVEYGFHLQFGEGCKIFNTELLKGTEETLAFGIPLEGYGIFGDFHVHTVSGFTEEEIEFAIMPSVLDLLINIDAYLVEKEFNYSVMMIASVETNKISIFIPRRDKPDIAFRDIFSRLLEMREVDLEILNILSDLYTMKQLILPLDHDIIISGISKEEPIIII